MKEGWEIKTLDVICDLITCGVAARPNYTENGVPFLSAKNIKNGRVIWSDYKFISKETHKELTKNNKPQKGDLLYTRVGSYGEAAIVDSDLEFSVFVSLTLIKPKFNLIHNEYLKNYLNSDAVKQLAKNSISGSGVGNLNVGTVRKFTIPLPPLPEQQRIVSIIDEAFEAIDKAIENTRKNLQNAKELFESYLHKFYNGTFEGWEEKKLKDVAEYFNGLTYSPKDVSNEGIIVLRSSNIQNDELNFNDIIRVNIEVKEKIKVKDGDILMCSRNGSARLVGKTATIKNLSEVMTFGTFMMIVRSPYNPYLAWFFKSEGFRNQIKGGENTMINQITRYMLDDISISFPPVHEQIEIVEKLDILSFNLNNAQTLYQQKLRDLEELKKSVLNKAFAGEL